MSGSQVVKSLDEVLVIKTQAAARLSGSQADGFVVQTPKATSVGGRYFLDQDILEAVGADFYSVADRMEVVVSAEQIEPVLTVLMKEKQITLAAFDFRDQAREYLGEALPSLELVESSNYATQGDYVPYVPEPTQVNRDQLETLLADERAIPLTSSGSESGISPSQVHAVASADVPMPDSVSLPLESFLESPGVVSRIAPAKEQSGGAEKQVAKFLENAGLAESVSQGEDFHLRIENEPYIPLVVERHGDQLYLTHYLTQNGDMFIDTEMVLGISDQGLLTLQETAVQSLGGEYRGYDRGFAQMFARNINHQGFAAAAQQSLEANTVEVPQAEAEAKDSSLFDLEPFQQTLQLDQHGDGGDPTWDVSTTEAASVPKRDVQSEPHQTQTNDAAAHGPDSELHATGPPANDLNGYSASSSNEVTVDLDALRGWYRAARDMGKGSERLEFIAKLGQLAKSYTDQTLTVPQEVQRVMAQDLDHYQVQQQRGKYVSQASQFILAAVGRSNGQGTRFLGKIYDLRQTSESLTVQKLKPYPQTILEVDQGKIQRTVVTAEDCQRFKVFVQRLERDRISVQNQVSSRATALER